MIQPLEPIEAINNRLAAYYGYFENLPRFRVVWSSDQFERKLVRETPEGLMLLSPAIVTAPKYMYARDKYILEKITPVPDPYVEQIGSKLSYEPIWVFEDAKGNPLPPKWEAIVAIFKSIEEMMKPKPPYKMPEGQGNTLEEIEYRAKLLEEQLYGNDEHQISNSLATGEAVGYGFKRRQAHTDTLNNPLRGKI